MKPSAEFLSGLPDADLLNYCEGEIEEFVTSNTELALIIKLNEKLETESETIAIDYVNDRLDEIHDYLPSDSLLDSPLDELDKIINSKLTKAEMLERLIELWEVLKDARDDLQRSVETIYSAIKDFY